MYEIWIKISLFFFLITVLVIIGLAIWQFHNLMDYLQGFLAKELQAEALNKLDHRVKVASEQFMKILEEVDGMVIVFHCYVVS